MKIFRFFNDLYDQLFDIKEGSWHSTKAAVSIYIVVFAVLLLVLFFALISFVKLFWKP